MNEPNPPVSTDTLARIQKVIENLHYVPHAAARSLSSNRKQAIGLLLPEIGGDFFHPLLRGIEAAGAEYGFDLLIHTTQMPRPASVARRPLAEHNTDGLLVFTSSLDTRELTRLNGIGFPMVLLYQTPKEGVNIPTVTIENQSGAQQLVSHLIEVHGRRRILFLRGPEGHEDSQWREKGYREALKAHGIPFDPALVTGGGFNRNEARQTMEQLLCNGADFDAIFAGDDDASVGVLLALRQAGRRVPEEIALAGFDDQVFASTITPPLTTVRAPTEQVGREAVRMLVRLIRGESVVPRLVLPTELVIRESCGCPHVNGQGASHNQGGE
jgi:DNA-binding LacI/PurR family transcriptional regulator